ncbi:hypothetical protein HSB1_23490 [Halogranum salarium B-1]|uniref:Uncharacterized protein n=1 Tax=Halogranum salarium B-1 TaxID=1210908 RepID=J3A0S3_9EURY|nr:hypothetical protein HSB1_23490 [Halogranum salarium B-1]
MHGHVVGREGEKASGVGDGHRSPTVVRVFITEDATIAAVT